MLNRIELAAGALSAARGVSRHGRWHRRLGHPTTSKFPTSAKTPFSMSGLVMTSMAGSSMVTAKGDDQTEGGPAGAADCERGLRAERRDRALRRDLRQRRPRRRTKSTSSRRSRAMTGGCCTRRRRSGTRASCKAPRAATATSARIPLTDVPPGDYVLNVQAKSRLGKDVGVGRQVRVPVTPPVRTPAALMLTRLLAAVGARLRSCRRPIVPT